jgi:peptidoglycan hydrolase CwlO-like protein
MCPWILYFHDIIDKSCILMKRKKFEKKIETLREQIIEHKEKIKLERQKSFPNEGCIIHWEKEIRAFENQISKASKKLEG